MAERPGAGFRTLATRERVGRREAGRHATDRPALRHVALCSDLLSWPGLAASAHGVSNDLHDRPHRRNCLLASGGVIPDEPGDRNREKPWKVPVETVQAMFF